eukprot:4487810-Alexandrium_andersonii.AAC.1
MLKRAEGWLRGALPFGRGSRALFRVAHVDGALGLRLELLERAAPREQHLAEHARLQGASLLCRLHPRPRLREASEIVAGAGVNAAV